MVDKKESEPVFLRTLIRKDVHDKLKEFAMQYSTGRGDWDFGVAVQILLDHYEDSKSALQSDKLDAILQQVMILQIKPEEPKKEEPQYEVMLGGEKILIEK